MIPPYPPALDPGEILSKGFPWVTCTLKGVTSADGRSSEDQVCSLREIQDTSITMDVGAEREKSYYFAFIFPSFLVS